MGDKERENEPESLSPSQKVLKKIGDYCVMAIVATLAIAIITGFLECFIAGFNGEDPPLRKHHAVTRFITFLGSLAGEIFNR